MKVYSLLISFGVASLLTACKESEPTSSTVADVELPEVEAPVSKKEESKSETKPTWPPASDTVDADLLKENYLVVLDDSGSMKGEKIEQAKEALLSLAQTLPAEHNLGLVLLNRSNTVALGLNNRDEFSKAIRSTRADGGTPLRAVATKAYKLITEKASAQRGYGKYHMIIVTDGESSDGSAMPLVKAMVKKTAIQVHVIGFHLKNHEMNQPKLVDYRTAGNSRELSQAFEAVAAETDEFSDPQEFTR